MPNTENDMNDSTIACPQCSQYTPLDVGNCLHCGASLEVPDEEPEELWECHVCHRKHSADMTKCPCGYDMERPPWSEIQGHLLFIAPFVIVANILSAIAGGCEIPWLHYVGIPFVIPAFMIWWSLKGRAFWIVGASGLIIAAITQVIVYTIIS